MGGLYFLLYKLLGYMLYVTSYIHPKTYQLLIFVLDISVFIV